MYERRTYLHAVCCETPSVSGGIATKKLCTVSSVTLDGLKFVVPGWCPGPDDGSLAEQKLQLPRSRCNGELHLVCSSHLVFEAHQCESLVPTCMRRRPPRGARRSPGSCRDYNKNPPPRQLCYVSLRILRHEPGSCYYLRQAPAPSLNFAMFR